MAFQEIELGHGGRCPRLVNTVSIYGRRGVVRIGISRDVADLIGWPPYMTVAIGTGPDAGRLALRPSLVRSERTYKVGKHGQRLTVGLSSKMVDFPEAFPKTATPFTVDDNGTIIMDVRGIRSVPVLAAAE